MAVDAAPPERQRVAAYALLTRDREVLLTQMSSRTRIEGRWTLPGGGIDHGEDPRDALRREVFEETGLRVEPGRVVDVHATHFVGARADGRVETEATIKIWVDGERYVRTAEGNGPVHALDRALREAIGERYPHLRDIELVNFKVRILDENRGTAAVTRVLLDSSDGTDTWGSIGVSENIIEASWEALVDSLEAGMLLARSGRAPASS